MASDVGFGPGRVLGGRYRVVRPLGRGGMATVWLGVDQQMGRQVAIKVMHINGPGHATAWARFEREARSTAAINHPHIVTVHDTGIDDGTAYMILELLPGPTLSQHLAENGPMPIPAVLDIVVQVCEALAAAHSLGIVHRDVKPSNVMFANHHRIKVLDFGITQFVGGAVTDATLTAPGESLGTPAFMSPEQIAGGRVDARTDLYALGCLITAMLAGKPPFHDMSPLSTIASHAHNVPPDVRLARRDTPAPLAALVATLLSKDPEDRPASAEVVLETVNGMVSAETTALIRGGRRRVGAIVVAALALVGAVGGVYTVAGAPGWPITQPAATGSSGASTPATVTPTTPAPATSAPAMVSLESTTLGGSEPPTLPLTQWCQHPDGYSVAYPQGWFVYTPSEALRSQYACSFFGPEPLDDYPWEGEGVSAPVGLSLWTDGGFDDVAYDTSGVVTSEESETIGSLRLSRVESVHVEDGVNAIPDRTPMVRWVVELPPDGSGGVLIGGAVPDGAVNYGVFADTASGSMDVAPNAAVLDAMIRTIVFTGFDRTVSVNESLILSPSGLGEAKLGMSMTDFAGALGADLKNISGDDPCYQASFVSDGNGFLILSEAGRNGPVQVIDVSSQLRPGRGLPVAGTAEGIHLGSTYADVVEAYPDAEVQVHPSIPGGERIIVAEPAGERALVFETDARGAMMSMRSGARPLLTSDDACLNLPGYGWLD